MTQGVVVQLHWCLRSGLQNVMKRVGIHAGIRVIHARIHAGVRAPILVGAHAPLPVQVLVGVHVEAPVQPVGIRARIRVRKHAKIVNQTHNRSSLRQLL